MKSSSHPQYYRYRHATSVANYEHIKEEGLLVAKCNPAAKRQAVWVHSPGRTPWAILHVAWAHSWNLEEVVVLDVSLGRHEVHRHGSGLWYVEHDIAVKCIKACVEAVAFARGSEA